MPIFNKVFADVLISILCKQPRVSGKSFADTEKFGWWFLAYLNEALIRGNEWFQDQGQ